mgnify:CR=1 FL=1
MPTFVGRWPKDVPAIAAKRTALKAGYQVQGFQTLMPYFQDKSFQQKTSLLPDSKTILRRRFLKPTVRSRRSHSPESLIRLIPTASCSVAACPMSPGYVMRSPQDGSAISSRTRSIRACFAQSTVTPAGFAAPHGCGENRDSAAKR